MDDSALEIAALRRENEALRAALDNSWRKAIESPFGRVCKHYLAGIILDQMERAGIVTPEWVYAAVVGCDDDKALGFVRGAQADAAT